MSTAESSTTVYSEDLDVWLENEPKQGWMGKSRRTFVAGKDKAAEMVQRNPYKTLALAAGIGFVAGVFLKRR